MGKDLAAAFPAAQAIFEQADDDARIPAVPLCFEGPDEELMATRNAQPALLTHGAAVWAAVRDRAAPARARRRRPLARRVHRLPCGGRVRVSRCAQARAPARGADVRERHEAPRRDGGDTRDSPRRTSKRRARARCDEGDVVPANYNTPEQLVISGEVAAVERAMAIAKELGAKRAIRLNVSGAFHSPLMEDAADGLKTCARRRADRAPALPSLLERERVSLCGISRCEEAAASPADIARALDRARARTWPKTFLTHSTSRWARAPCSPRSSSASFPARER